MEVISDSFRRGSACGIVCMRRHGPWNASIVRIPKVGMISSQNNAIVCSCIFRTSRKGQLSSRRGRRDDVDGGLRVKWLSERRAADTSMSELPSRGGRLPRLPRAGNEHGNQVLAEAR